MTKVIIGLALALVMAGCADKADAGDWYGQGGIGITKYDFDGASDDQEGTSYFGSVGYIYDNNLGVEFEYQYVDEADLSSNVKMDETSFYTLYGVGRVPLDHKDKVNLILKGGVGYADGTLKANGFRDKDDDSWYPAIGAGVEWLFTDSWAAVALVDYRVYDFSSGGNDFAADPITYKAGIQYRF